MNDSDSAALVQKIVEGDASAMITLYDRTNRLLYGLVLRVLPENTAAEETLLEAYTRLWRQPGIYDPRGGTPLAWMMGVARTCAIERLRSRAPESQTPERRPLTEIDGAGQPPTEESNVEDVRQQLVRSAADAAPPDYIRDLLALRIEREPRAAAVATPRLPVSEAERLELKHAVPPRPVGPPLPQSRSSVIPWILAASCAVAAALFFFMWRQSQKQSDQAIQWERDAAHEARAEAERLQSLTDREKIRRQEIDALDAALASPGANAIFLAGRRPDTPAAAVIFWNTRKSSWIIIGHLVPPPAGKEYQVWYVIASGRKSAGLIPVDTSGHGFATIEIPPDIAKIAAAEITLEPAGGSEQPTSSAIAAGRAGP